MAGVLGKAGVLCNSDNFLESLENSSPFCTISGKLHCLYKDSLSYINSYMHGNTHTHTHTHTDTHAHTPAHTVCRCGSYLWYSSGHSVGDISCPRPLLGHCVSIPLQKIQNRRQNQVYSYHFCDPCPSPTCHFCFTTSHRWLQHWFRSYN